MKKVLSIIFSLGIILLFASCGNDNDNQDNSELLNEKYHVHEIDESKTVHHDANCLHDEFDEYFCECGKRIGYDKDLETHINHTFQNGVCTKCGCEESKYEIELITPTTCKIINFTMEENEDVVIPDKIYGIDVVEVQCDYSNEIPTKLNSFTFGKNLKKINISLQYEEEVKIKNGRMFIIEYVTHTTEIGEVNYASTINDFVNIEFMEPSANPLIGAKKATINGEDIKNLVLPDDINLTNSLNTFVGSYFESITLPDNLSTMGKKTFDFDSMNESLLNYDIKGTGYLKSKSNDKYMLAKFSDNSGNITIDSNVKMIYGPAWLNCKHTKVTINDNVNYFTDIFSEADWTAYDNKFKGELVYTGTLENWFKKEFLRYRDVDFSDSYLSETSYFGDINDVHSPVRMALKFTCGDTIVKESESNLGYSPEDITLTIPEGVEKTNNFALEGCRFTKIYIPKSLKTIGTRSLGIISSIPYKFTENEGKLFPSVYYAGSITDWLNIDFDSYLANPFINDIEYSTWYDNECFNWTNKFYINNNELVSNLVIPEGIKEIKTAQFAGINSIVSVSFPSTLEYIGEFAFSRCKNIYAGNDSNGLSIIVSKLLESKNDTTENHYYEYHYLEDANLDLEKLNEELPKRVFDIIIPKTVKYIGMCAFETYNGGIHMYIPKEVEYVSTYALCTGRIADYSGSCRLNYLYTDRDNASDLKWNFLQPMNYDQVLTAIYITSDNYSFASPIICNVGMDDIVAIDYNHYKKIDDNTLLPLKVNPGDIALYYIYANDSIEPIKDTFNRARTFSLYDNINLIKGIEINGKSCRIKLDNNFILFLQSRYYDPFYSFYITRDVTSIDFSDEVLQYLSVSSFYYEGTEEEWNNICSNKNIKVTYNCRLEPYEYN